MNDYIKRADAAEAVWRILNGMGILQKHNDRLVEEVDAVLEEYPAADVRPVVRGKWGKCVGENGVTSACRCSLCGFEDNRFSVFNYCPNCGAKMEES